MSLLKEFLSFYGRIEDVKQAISLLSWDQQVYLPEGASEARGQQLASLGSISHEMLTSSKMKDYLSQLAKENFKEDSDEATILARAAKSFERATKLPSDFIEAFTKQRAKASNAWVKARASNDFKAFEPELRKIIEMTRQEADFLGFDEHPYDALHDEYEMGSTAAQLKPMFAELRDESVKLLDKLKAGTAPDDSIIHSHFDLNTQREVAEAIAKKLGFDFNHGRLDPTVHPFAQDISKYDVRITTRYFEDFFNPAFFGTMHEAGHAMYEQGIADKYYRTPLGAAISLGIHESQSRLFENLVGRSYEFWQGYYADLQAAFPHLKSTSLDTFYGAINKVEPSLIRVEADEVTYNLHILIRFELELALLEASLDVADLPEAWNEKYQAYLGITPPNDAEGCLQDVHWSEALIGYFPTYTLGNLASVQLFEAAQKAHPTIKDDMRSGDFSKLLGWLRENIHSHGSRYTPHELITKATGEALSAKAYVAYLDKKFSSIYGV